MKNTIKELENHLSVELPGWAMFRWGEGIALLYRVGQAASCLAKNMVAELFSYTGLRSQEVLLRTLLLIHKTSYYVTLPEERTKHPLI